jgi:hypothetical protein
LNFEAALVAPPACAGTREPTDKSAITAVAAKMPLYIAISSIEQSERLFASELYESI